MDFLSHLKITDVFFMTLQLSVSQFLSHSHKVLIFYKEEPPDDPTNINLEGSHGYCELVNLKVLHF